MTRFNSTRIGHKYDTLQIPLDLVILIWSLSTLKDIDDPMARFIPMARKSIFAREEQQKQQEEEGKKCDQILCKFH